MGDAVRVAVEQLEWWRSQGWGTAKMVHALTGVFPSVPPSHDDVVIEVIGAWRRLGHDYAPEFHPQFPQVSLDSIVPAEAAYVDNSPAWT